MRRSCGPRATAAAPSMTGHGGTGSVYVLVRKSRAAKELTREAYGQKSDRTD